MDPVAGWYDDPTGRHEHRYWDGSQWSDRVRDQGSESVDPVAGGPPGGDVAATDAAAAGADLPAEPEPEDRADTGTPWTAPGDASASQGPSTTGGLAAAAASAGTPGDAGGSGDAAPTGGGELPPAGWYPDPSTPGQQRYWDGNQWTEHTHQPSGASGTQGYASSGYGRGAGAAGGMAGGMAAGPGATNYGAARGDVQTWLIPSILATVFCCLPLGIVGIVFAARANSRLGEGNVAAAREAADKAKLWTLVSVGAGVLLWIVMVLGGFWGSMTAF